MNKKQIKLREQILYLNWQILKSDATMEDFAEIYSMGTSNVHRIVSKWEDKRVEDFSLPLQGLARLIK